MMRELRELPCTLLRAISIRINLKFRQPFFFLEFLELRFRKCPSKARGISTRLF